MTRQYLEAARTVLGHGTRKPNRTGVDSISTFGVHMEHDLRDGFPLLTTKEINWFHIVVELLWFLSGRTDIGLLKRHGVKFWDAWADAKGEVPSAYGAMWTGFPAERLVAVPPRQKQKPENRPFLRRHFDPVDIGAVEADGIVGQRRASANCGDFVVVEDTGCGSGRHLYKVQFASTGYVCTVRGDVIETGQIRDPFYPSLYGAGHRGAREIETDLDRDLYKVWSHMIERCYSPACKEYELYGAVGVFVEDAWLSWTTFRGDCEKLPNWRAKRDAPNAFQLDKDYYSSNCYSRDTCVWLSKRDNVRYQKSRAFEVTTPEGDTFVDISRADVADAYDLSSTCIGDVLAERQPATKGYRFRYVDGPPLRYGLPNDQIAWVVEELRRNPMSRRCVVSAWAPGNAQTSALPPCHVLFALNVQNLPPKPALGVTVEIDPDAVFAAIDRPRDVVVWRSWAGKPLRVTGLGGFGPLGRVAYGPGTVLDSVYVQPPDGSLPTHVPISLLKPEPHLCLHLTQRSCDMFLGVPYNIASYALLLTLVAKLVGLKPGTLSHTLIDAHFYTAKADGRFAGEGSHLLSGGVEDCLLDHVPLIRMQLDRMPKPPPKLVIRDGIRELADVARLVDDKEGPAAPAAQRDNILDAFRLFGYDPYPAIRGRPAV